MTRTQSTLVWGLALIAGAAVLAWQQSITWALGAAGAVPTLAAVVAFIAEEDATNKAKVAERRAVWTVRSARCAVCKVEAERLPRPR